MDLEKIKLMKDSEHLGNMGDTPTLSNQRVLPMNTCLQVIEMAQIEDLKAIDALTTTCIIVVWSYF